MTVPVVTTRESRPCESRPCKDHNVVTVKRVGGHLLRRDESYSEAIEEDRNPSDEGVELMWNSLKPIDLSRHPKMASDASSYAPVNSSPALPRNVRAWCDATGLPTTITVRCKDRVFHLHKFPLVSRSGYLKRALKDATEITLPRDTPGGAAIFELVSNFCYGSTILMEPGNIAELCCVADYLEMTEDYGRANLCERSELYLTQVALQSWDDTLVVLQHCERLAPHAEQLGIERRCLDALAFMACMELLDPVARKLNGDVKQGTQYLHWWVQDLVALPPSLFVNLVLALRREGMQENYVGQVITAFAEQWIFALDVMEGLRYGDKHAMSTQPSVLIESVVKVLPLERHVVPIGFLFALLRRGLTCALNDDCRIQLEARIVLQLENATLHDLLLPGKKEKESMCVIKNELESMERILKLFLTRIRSFDDSKAADVEAPLAVAKLWDKYLAEIAFDSTIAPARFADLIERVPSHMREAQDDVYRAIHAYLEAHPSVTQEERLTVCRSLNCQKLSQEACAHAVQNEFMPLRMIVQAMFMQQLQTRSVLNSHLESASQSFRDHPDVVDAVQHGHSRSMIVPDAIAALSSHPPAGNSGRLLHGHTCDRGSRDHSRDHSFRSIGSSFRDNDLYIDDVMYAAASHNTAVLKKEIAVQQPPKGDFQATESRLRSLEVELSRMRKTLARQAAASSSTNSTPNPKNCNPNVVVPVATHLGRSGPLSAPCKMATVHEAGVATSGNSCGSSSGCMSQLKPVNRTSHGLLAKALQKLRSFGKSGNSKSTAVKDISAPSSATPRPPKFESDMGRELVGRTDSMPRPAAMSRVKPPRHTRRNSLS